MSFKRCLSEQSTNIENKKAKTESWSNNYFHKTLEESGLILKHPPEKCIANYDTFNIIANIKKTLESNFDYPRNVSELYSSFEKESQKIDVFKHYLYPNVIFIENETKILLKDSVIKILLNIPILQTKLIDHIFEKAVDLAAQSMCGPWIQMILKCVSSLGHIIDGEKLSTHLIDLLDIASEKSVRLEIITAIPDIINDNQYTIIASEMSRVLGEDHDLVPAILDCLTNLCPTDQEYEKLQKKTLTILAGLTQCKVFPNFVKFLLIPGRLSDDAYFEVVLGLRNALSWPMSITDRQEIASSQVLTATAIRNSMITSKVICNAWLKVISMCKSHTEHKPIDLVILIVLYTISEEKKRQVENVLKKQIKLNILREELVEEAFDKFNPILKDSLRNLIELTNTLLKPQAHLLIESMASHIYTLMFFKLDGCGHTIVGKLLQLGLASKLYVMKIILIFSNVATKDISLIRPYSAQILTPLDRISDMSVTEVRAVMDLLCNLAYTTENSPIRDDMHMIIRKELSSSNLKLKIQGVLAGIHAVKYLMVTNHDDSIMTDLPNNISYGTTSHLPEGNIREAAQIIDLICRSTKWFPEITEFFYDELSKVICSISSINKNFLLWLTDAVTNDLTQNFIVDTIENFHEDLRLSMEFYLNEENEMDQVIAINIGGLTLQPRSEVCIAILSPLFQLVQILHSKNNNGNMSDIDALLGCAIVMPIIDLDTIQDQDPNTITNILNCIVHTVNWFIELLNAFTSQDDCDFKKKILTRLKNIEELQSLIADILLKSKISYKIPNYKLNINKYFGDSTADKKMGSTQITKQNFNKIISQDDSVLPETQATQSNNTSAKNRVNLLQNISFRPMNLNLLKILKNDLTKSNETDEGITVKTLSFILECIQSKIEELMISKIKRRTFLSKQDYSIYDPKKGEECAKRINEILPKMMAHLEYITQQIKEHVSPNDSSNFFYTNEILDCLACLEKIYSMFTIFLNWIEFRKHHSGLFKSSLRTIANSESSTATLKELLIAIAEKFNNHQEYCLQLSTAMSLIMFLKTVQSYADNKKILNILRNMAHNFLSRQWKTPDGAIEKGLTFNQNIDCLTAIYVMNNEILELRNLSFQLMNDVKLLKTRNDSLTSLKSINKNNFTILYRNLGTALCESIKNTLNKRMTNSEHVHLWKEVVNIIKYLSDIAKSYDSRNNLSAFFKKTLPVLRLFLSHGLPIIEIQFKNDTEEIVEILKTLQQSTRFLHNLCCHSRLKKDKMLMAKVPYTRELLETLVYKVKATLVANKCSEAFWMGNLKNKDINGEVIVSQSSTDEEIAEDYEEQLPEDEDSDITDDEMLDLDSRPSSIID